MPPGESLTVVEGAAPPWDAPLKEQPDVGGPDIACFRRHPAPPPQDGWHASQARRLHAGQRRSRLSHQGAPAQRASNASGAAGVVCDRLALAHDAAMHGSVGDPAASADESDAGSGADETFDAGAKGGSLLSSEGGAGTGGHSGPAAWASSSWRRRRSRWRCLPTEAGRGPGGRQASVRSGSAESDLGCM